MHSVPLSLIVSGMALALSDHFYTRGCCSLQLHVLVVLSIVGTPVSQSNCRSHLCEVHVSQRAWFVSTHCTASWLWSESFCLCCSPWLKVVALTFLSGGDGHEGGVSSRVKLDVGVGFDAVFVCLTLVSSIELLYWQCIKVIEERGTNN